MDESNPPAACWVIWILICIDCTKCCLQYNISLLRFRQRVENLCAERVSLASLCSLKAQGKGNETEEWEWERNGEGEERQKDEARDSSHVFMICLFVLPRGSLFFTPHFLLLFFFFFLQSLSDFFFPSCICRLSRQRALFHSRLMSQLKLMCSVCSDKEERGGKSLSRNNGSVLHIGNQSFLVWAHANASQHWQL